MAKSVGFDWIIMQAVPEPAFYKRNIINFNKRGEKMLNAFKFRRWRRNKGINKKINQKHIIWCDSVKLDVTLIDPKTGLPLGRPWMTIGVDAYTKYVMGAYLSFESPERGKRITRLAYKNAGGTDNERSKDN